MSRSGLAARNLVTTLAPQIVAWALTLGVTFYLPRYLGDVRLGELTLAISVVGIFGVLVSLGTSSVLLRVPLSLAMTLPAIGAAYLLDDGAVVRTLIVVGALGMTLASLNDVFVSARQGRENPTRTGAAFLTETLLGAGLTIALVIARTPLWTFVAVGLLTGGVSLLVNLSAFRSSSAAVLRPWADRARALVRAVMITDLPLLRRLLRAFPPPPPAPFRALIQGGRPYLGPFVFFTLFGQVNAVVIHMIANDATVGWYAAAYRIIGVTLIVPAVIATVMLPALSRLFHEDRHKFDLLARRTLGLIMLCGIPIAAVLIFLPGRVIGLMHYPQQFNHSIPALRVGGAAVLLWFATCFIAPLASACGRQQDTLRTFGIAADLGIPACFLLTYVTYRFYGNGATGALLSDVLVEVFLLVASIKMFPAGTFVARVPLRRRAAGDRHGAEGLRPAPPPAQPDPPGRRQSPGDHGAGGSRSGLVARNLVVTLASQIVSWALTFGVTFYLPKYLGDVRLGQLTLAASVVSIFGVFVSLGTSYVLIKDIARDRSRTGELLIAAMLLRVPLSLAMTLLAIGAAYLLGYETVVRTLIVVGALGMIIGSLNDALASALQGQENLPRTSAAFLTDKVLAAGLTIALVIARAPLWTFVAVGLLTGGVSLLVNLSAFRPLFAAVLRPWAGRARALARSGMITEPALLRRLLRAFPLPPLETFRYLVREGRPYIGLFVFFTIFGQTDAIVIRMIANDATVGWYAAAYRIIGITMFFPTAIATAMLPTLSRLFHESRQDFDLLARRTLGLIMLCGIPIAAVLIFLPDRIIGLMHYPQQFNHSIPALRVGGAAVLLWFATCYIARLAAACDRQQNIFRTSVIAATLGIPACFLLTYVTYRFYGNGATGALLSDVLVELYLLVTYIKMLPEGTFNVESLSFIGRCVAAATPMIALMAFVPSAKNSLWTVIPCGATYAVACWLLRCIDPQDIAMVRKMFRQKVSSPV